MIEACEIVVGFVRGRDAESFKSDLQFQFAATHALQIALEAASRVGADTKAALPEIAWVEMNGMRNRLVHAYFDTDLDILWRTITVAVSPMLATLRAFVADA